MIELSKNTCKYSMFCKMNRVTVKAILAEFTVTMPLVSAEHKPTAALAPKTSFVIDTLMLTAMSIICTLIHVCKNEKNKINKIVSEKLICNNNKLLYLIITNVCQKVG